MKLSTNMKDKALAFVFAKAIAAFTTKNPQNVPRPLVEKFKATPAAKTLKKRYNAESFTVESFDGLRLNITRFRTVRGCSWEGKNHVVLLVHGFQVQQAMMWPTLPFFLPHRYDCVTVDLRTAGLSEGRGINTMGANEAKDVAAVCRWIRREYGDDVVLGLYGQSMGSATIMQYSSEDPNLGFIIEDCGYASLEDTIHNIQSRFLKFLNWDEFWPLVLKFAKVGDVDYTAVKPIDSVRKLDPDIPMMILHSYPDAYIVVKNADEIFAAKQGKKVIHKYTKAPHSASFIFHPIKYYKDISAFLKNNRLAPEYKVKLLPWK